MAVPILLFLLGFAMLIKGGDWFVDGAAEKDFTAGEVVDGCGVGRTSVIAAIQAGQSQVIL